VDAFQDGKQAIAEWFYMAAPSDDPMPPGCNIVLSTIQPVIRQGLAQIRSAPPSMPDFTFVRGAAFRGLLSANSVAGAGIAVWPPAVYQRGESEEKYLFQRVQSGVSLGKTTPILSDRAVLSLALAPSWKINGQAALNRSGKRSMTLRP
jgi:hypothetical protein